MDNMHKKIIRLETTGVFFIIFAGALLHFAFEWSGNWLPVAFLAAVNESTWEHLKMAFWPALLYAIFERFYLKGRMENFWLAKSAELTAVPLIIITAFYSYTTLLGTHLLWLDILIFVVSVICGQLISYRIIIVRPFGHNLRSASVLWLAILTLCFALFSYLPPCSFLFIDPRSGTCGIQESQ